MASGARVFLLRSFSLWEVVVLHYTNRTRERTEIRALRYEAQVGGWPVRYEVAGEGEPIVLVYGLSGSTRWWARNVQAIAERSRVYLIDLPGFGTMRHLRRRFVLAPLDYHCQSCYFGFSELSSKISQAPSSTLALLEKSSALPPAVSVEEPPH
jgi:hypothetical protein